jgi:hypothetical protein
MRAWIIVDDEAQSIEVDTLASDQCYLIPVREQKKVYVWAGSQCHKMQRYKPGTLATKLKSSEKLYGFEIENIEQGNEPAGFPLGSNNEVISPPVQEVELFEPREVTRAEKPAKREPIEKRVAPPTAPAEKRASIADNILAIKQNLSEIKAIVAKIWEKVESLPSSTSSAPAQATTTTLTIPAVPADLTLFAWKWDDRGPEFFGGYPESEELPPTLLMQIFGQHAAGGDDPGFLAMSNDQQSIGSYYCGAETRLYLGLITHEKFDLSQFENGLEYAAEALGSNVDTSEIARILPELFDLVINPDS